MIYSWKQYGMYSQSGRGFQECILIELSHLSNENLKL